MKTFKTPKGTELPLMDIKGKDYLQVAYRVQWFRSEHPMGKIESECVENTKDYVVYKATISFWDEQAKQHVKISDGYKREDYKHFQDAHEKASTGAIGRALALASFGTQFALADLDEGERLADAPLGNSENPSNSGPSAVSYDKEVPGQAKTGPSDPGSLYCDWGKYKGMMVKEIDHIELDGYCKWLMSKAEKDGKKVTGKVKDFIVAAGLYLDYACYKETE